MGFLQFSLRLPCPVHAQRRACAPLLVVCGDLCTDFPSRRRTFTCPSHAHRRACAPLLGAGHMSGWHITRLTMSMPRKQPADPRSHIPKLGPLVLKLLVGVMGGPQSLLTSVMNYPFSCKVQPFQTPQALSNNIKACVKSNVASSIIWDTWRCDTIGWNGFYCSFQTCKPVGCAPAGWKKLCKFKKGNH